MKAPRRRPDGKPTYAEVLAAAVNDIAEHGYDSEERLARWQKLLAEAAESAAGSEEFLDDLLRRSLLREYERLVGGDALLKLHPGVSRFTIEHIRPQLRAQLDRSIAASADLIRLNKAEAVRKTLQRFSGWATSVPPGGAIEESRRKTKVEIKKSLSSLPFTERRVLIDQGHKLSASINRIVAVEGGAIGCIWHSHYRQAGYDYRVDHKERDGHFYLMKNSWAKAAGLVKPGPSGYYEDITAAAQEPFCRCFVTWVYSIGRIPVECLTKKGEASLAEVRAKMMGAA